MNEDAMCRHCLRPGMPVYKARCREQHFMREAGLPGPCCPSTLEEPIGSGTCCRQAISD